MQTYYAGAGGGCFGPDATVVRVGPDGGLPTAIPITALHRGDLVLLAGGGYGAVVCIVRIAPRCTRSEVDALANPCVRQPAIRVAAVAAAKRQIWHGRGPGGGELPTLCPEETFRRLAGALYPIASPISPPDSELYVGNLGFLVFL